MKTHALLVLLFGLLSQPATGQVATPVRIPVNTPTALSNWSDLLEFKGYVHLTSDVTHQVLNLQNLLFVDDKIIALDVDSDFSAVRVYDGKTGKYLYDIGQYMKSDDPEQGFYGVLDIAWNPDRKYLRMLSNGQRCFSDYTPDGTYLGSVKTGAFGENLAYMGEDKWLMYNEHNAVEPTGSHYLLFFNGKGDLIRSDFPYPSSLDGYANGFAGYVVRSGNEVWFNPLFSDTIYGLTGNVMQPRFLLDLGPGAVPPARRNTPVTGNELMMYDFAHKGFFSNGRYCIFPFQKNRTMPLGIFDTATGSFYDSGSLDKSVPLNNLLRTTRGVFAKDGETLVISTPVQRLKFLLKNADRTAWEALAPGLYDLVTGTPEDLDNPVLFFFRFKQP